MGLLYRLHNSEQRTAVDWIYASFCTRIADPGYNTPVMSTWIEAYNTADNSWHRLGTVPDLGDDEILKGFGMVAIGASLYIVGGRICHKTGGAANPPDNNNGCETPSAPSPSSEIDIRVRDEVYKLDCVRNEWRRCASLHAARVDFACSVHGGKIYVAGGRNQTPRAKGVSSAEVYDPEQDTWTVLPNMSTGRYKCVGVTWEEKIYIVGGFAGPEDSEKTILPFTNDRSSVEVYDPAEGRWDIIHGMWQLDVPPNQIVTVNDRLFSSGDCLNLWKGHIEAYDSRVNMWTIVDGSHLRTMSHAIIGATSYGGYSPSPSRGEQYERLYLTMAAVRNKLYFLGGYRLPMEYGRCVSTIHLFDTSPPVEEEHQRWQSFEPLEDTVCKEMCSHCCVVTI